MKYKIVYVDGSQEFCDEDNIADARREANCRYNCPVKSIIAQDPDDCEDEDDDVEDEEDDEEEEEEEEEDDDND